MPSKVFLDHSSTPYEEIEDAFQTELDTSLNPRGVDYLLDIVGTLGFEPGATALDVGCGEGRYALELASRFELSVHGVDPLLAHIEVCNQKRLETATARPELAKRLRFDLGEVEDLPEEDARLDLVWFRDALVHVAAVDRAFGECYRVLRPGGYLVLYHQLGTDRLEPREASWLWRTMGVVARNTDASYIESAYATVGFELVQRVELRSEWMENNEETKGAVSRQVLHAARLLRSPDRYLAQFGQRAYDIMLGDCLWHIYQMIGKLSPRIYLLRKP
jgi:ubiquinone/menaquinone biosynthesis C-methylase UbiE